MRKIFFLLWFTAVSAGINAQEIKANITIVSSRVGNTVNLSVFRTLQTALNNFINNRKWTSDNFQPNERIECSFLLNLEATADANVYNADLTVQAARPVLILLIFLP